MTPVEQQPIPSEHVLLYTIFNGLLTQCKARANNNVSINNGMEWLYNVIPLKCIDVIMQWV